MRDLLPSSRLLNPKATVMADWPQPDGTTVRLELEPCYCFQCGKPGPYIPLAVTHWAAWLCPPCSLAWGEEAAALFSPDRQFWEDVAHEMDTRFGRHLSAVELQYMADQGRLGTALEKLARESPVKTRD